MQSGGIAAYVPAGSRARYADIERQPGLGAPYLGHALGAREDPAVSRFKIGIEQTTGEKAAGGLECRGYEHGVDVIRKTPAPQSRVAVPPLAHRHTGFKRDQIR